MMLFVICGICLGIALFCTVNENWGHKTVFERPSTYFAIIAVITMICGFVSVSNTKIYTVASDCYYLTHENQKYITGEFSDSDDWWSEEASKVYYVFDIDGIVQESKGTYNKQTLLADYPPITVKFKKSYEFDGYKKHNDTTYKICLDGGEENKINHTKYTNFMYRKSNKQPITLRQGLVFSKIY